MGTHWTDKRKALANLGEELARRGWTLYGYTEDRSDSMTDLYLPAAWHGVAERNGFVTCVDVKVRLVNEKRNGWPKFCPNPGAKKWHVETGGRIIASGTGIYSAARSATTVQQICDRIEAACQTRAPRTEPVTVEGVTVRENEEMDGVEVIFPAKPSTEVLHSLKAGGFRWSQRQGLWWAHRTNSTLTLARTIAAQ